MLGLTPLLCLRWPTGSGRDAACTVPWTCSQGRLATRCGLTLFMHLDVRLFSLRVRCVFTTEYICSGGSENTPRILIVLFTLDKRLRDTRTWLQSLLKIPALVPPTSPAVASFKMLSNIS